jgi:hypothetical protein
MHQLQVLLLLHPTMMLFLNPVRLNDRHFAMAGQAQIRWCPLVSPQTQVLAQRSPTISSRRAQSEEPWRPNPGPTSSGGMQLPAFETHAISRLSGVCVELQA